MNSSHPMCAPSWAIPDYLYLPVTIQPGRTWGPFIINRLPRLVGWLFANTVADVVRVRVSLTLNGHIVSVLGTGCPTVPYATVSSDDFSQLIDYLAWAEISLSVHRDGFFWINDLSDDDLEALIDDFLWSDA